MPASRAKIPRRAQLMRRGCRLFSLAIFLGVSLAAQARGPLAQITTAKPVAPPPLVLAGGTIIDVTDWGRSANDLHDAVIYVRDGRITAVGPRNALPIPKGAKVIDCTGKYLVPGFIDGFAGSANQGQASAHLYMGVTTIVTNRTKIDEHANPTPHLYLLDSIGTTDMQNRLIHNPEWSERLTDPKDPKDPKNPNPRSVELTPSDTARELSETAKIGTRVLWIGHNITAANSQWIIEHAHQQGLVTYGEFVATSYKVGIQAGVDALLHMGRYELGVIPDELQQPLGEDPEGSASRTAYGYAERLPANDYRLRDYARFLASHRTALMPTFSQFYLRLPDHRNLWLEPAARLLDPKTLGDPADASAVSDPKTGEAVYPLALWTRHLPNTTIRWMQESVRRKANQQADRLWAINQNIFEAYPHYLAATGAPANGTMPGISMHTELEMLVRLGLSPREAIAAATNNYAEQFHWTELGQITPGRRADILVLDGDPTTNIWNARRINTLLIDGNQLDRESLLRK